jgi:hypothetical protein
MKGKQCSTPHSIPSLKMFRSSLVLVAVAFVIVFLADPSRGVRFHTMTPKVNVTIQYYQRQMFD